MLPPNGMVGEFAKDREEWIRLAILNPLNESGLFRAGFKVVGDVHIVAVYNRKSRKLVQEYELVGDIDFPRFVPYETPEDIILRHTNQVFDNLVDNTKNAEAS